MSEHRITIGLDDVLYAQLAACGSQGQPLAAVVRQALTAYFARQPETPQSAPVLAMTVAALAARLDGLQDQMDALTAQVEALAARRQPPGASTRQPPGATAADTPPTGADTPAPPRRPGRPSGPLRHLILDLLRIHREGLRAEEIRVYLRVEQPRGGTLTGMVRGGVIAVQGQGPQRRYVLAP